MKIKKAILVTSFKFVNLDTLDDSKLWLQNQRSEFDLVTQIKFLSFFLFNGVLFLNNLFRIEKVTTKR